MFSTAVQSLYEEHPNETDVRSHNLGPFINCGINAKTTSGDPSRPPLVFKTLAPNSPLLEVHVVQLNDVVPGNLPLVDLW